MTGARHILADYVISAKVMQLATVGAPSVCNLWFAATLAPDRLFFISRPTRFHCAYLRKEPRVAGAMLSGTPEELGGDPARGVTFAGTATELATTGVDEQIAIYLGRWPNAARAIDPGRLARGENHHRIYQIDVNAWTLFDEEHFEPPKQEVAAITA